MMALEPHGTDVWVGTGPRYPWGGLYGGQIVAQGLRAGTFTVDDDFRVHRCTPTSSARATTPSRSASRSTGCATGARSDPPGHGRQSVGVILEMTASYQVDEDAIEVQTATVPPIKAPEDLADDSWSPLFDRRMAPAAEADTSGWLKVADAIGTIRPCRRAAWPTCPTTCRPRRWCRSTPTRTPNGLSRTSSCRPASTTPSTSTSRWRPTSGTCRPSVAMA